MSEIELDIMRVEDIEEVAEIEKAVFSMPWSKEAFEDTIQKDMTIYIVAKKQGKVAGYCGLWISFDEADIMNVAVDAKYRRQGIAKQMLSFLMEKAKEKGVERFTLEVRESNQSAINLYEKLGFKSVGLRKNFYSKPTENANIMWKE